jgi:hypothetical protein
VFPLKVRTQPQVKRAGYLDPDGGMLFIGPEAERRFRQRIS